VDYLELPLRKVAGNQGPRRKRAGYEKEGYFDPPLPKERALAAFPPQTGGVLKI